MEIPRPLNTQERYLYALNIKLDTLIELLTPKPEPVAKAAPKRRTTKKEA